MSITAQEVAEFFATASGRHTLMGLIPELAALIAQQAARIEELEKDGARYRWLRNSCDSKESRGTRIAANLYGMEWDEAIDAAIRQQSEGGAA